MRSIEIKMLIKSINLRVGSFLKNERILAGKSKEDLANTFNIEMALISKWESGLESLPASLYFSIVSYYGQQAVEKAQQLMWELQKEKNNFIKRINHQAEKSFLRISK